MEKELLKQRYNFAEIDAYRDYNQLQDKPKNMVGSTFDFDEYDVNNISDIDLIRRALDVGPPKFKIGRGGMAYSLPSRNDERRKNTKFFYTGGETGENIKLCNYFRIPQTFITNKQRHIVNHFGRPLSNITLTTYERSIFLKGDKLTLKFSTFRKSRFLNCRYFKKSSSNSGITFNLKTGDFITYEGSKKSSRVRKNFFTHLYHILDSSLLSKATNSMSHNMKDTKFKESIRVRENLIKEFDDVTFYETLYHFFNTIDGYSTTVPFYSSPKDCSVWLMENLVELFVKIKEIKVPNDYHKLLTTCYPTKKFLQKNDNKLVAAVLDRVGVKSKQTIKLLHENPNLDLEVLYVLRKYFGDEISKILPNIDTRIFNTDSQIKAPNLYQSVFSFLNHQKNIKNYNLSKSEKYCLIKLLNEFAEQNSGVNPSSSFFKRDVLNQQLNQISDHFNMISQVSEYYPDTMMKAKTWSEFHSEHLELSKLQRTIKRGYIIEYIFDKRLVDIIKEPIKTNDETFYPVLLKQDIEYSEEGSHMHHCVASYSNKEISIIISLRKDDPFGTERVTNEFDVRDKSCLQSRYFCNAAPPENFVEALDILKTKILEYKGSIKSLEKREIPLVINGKQVQPKVESLDIFGF